MPMYSCGPPIHMAMTAPKPYPPGPAMKKLSPADVAAMEEQLRGSLAADVQAKLVNDVKCDAIYTAKTYEEFADRVAAAHLRPLERSDFKKKPGWNQFAAKQEDYNE